MSEKPAPGTAVMDSHGAPLCHIGCPREPGRICAAWVKPAPDALWTNHGTRESPTLEPSYNCEKGCGWHGYVVDGKLTDTPSPGISTLLVCPSRKHPEIFTAIIGAKPTLTPGVIGIDVKFKRTEVRAIPQPQE